ncbi:MAG: RidA family protein [Ectothiorhodospiraceae bacterium]|nr:RidA family protein [Ectothiorhodospiraceae bacterium]
MGTIRRTAPYGGTLHEVVEHGETLYLAGIVAEELSPDMTAQAEDVMRQLETLLADNGSDLSRLLQVTIYFTDLAAKPAFDAVWKRRIGAAHMPARAGIGVADLGAGVLLEMVATAAKG